MKKNAIIINMAWRFAERTGAQFVQLIVSIVLARILMPEDYGVIAIVNIFIGLLEIFIENGLGNSLIQKKDSDDVDFSTVFYANIFVCISLYVILWLTAPLISYIYNDALLVNVLRVTGILIIISSVKNIQQAYVAKKLLFKKFFFATLGGTIAAGIVGIWMAINGFGVWALVAQKLVNYTIDTFILWITVGWRPIRKFSFARLTILYSFGWKILASSLINQLMCDFRQLLVGKFYTSKDLAFYNRGNQFPSILMTNISLSVDSVLFPVLSKKQDSKEEIYTIVSRAISMSEYILLPILIGLMICSKQVVGVLITHKWDGCVPYIIILSISYLFTPIYLLATNAMKAIGRSDIYLKFKLTQNIFSLVAVLVLIKIGPIAIAISLMLTNLFGQIYSLFIMNKHIGYSFTKFVDNNYKTIIISLFMGVIIWFIGKNIYNDVICLLLQVIIGVIVYFTLSGIWGVDDFVYFRNLMRNQKWG